VCLAEAVPTEYSRCNDACCLCTTEGAPGPDRLTHCMYRKYAIPAVPGKDFTVFCFRFLPSFVTSDLIRKSDSSLEITCQN
jgi:hypothetical protein